MSEQLFRIGGVYRINVGSGGLKVATLDPQSSYCASAIAPAGFGYAVSLDRMACHALINLTTGLSQSGWMHLIPGELHEVNSEWVPTDSPEIVQGFGDVSTAVPSRTPTLDKLERETEPKRPPLAYHGQRAKFDPFKGYVVVYEGEGNEPSAPKHALQRVTPIAFIKD